MGIFDKLRKAKVVPFSPPLGKQAVLLYLKGEDFDQMIALSDSLEAVILKNDIGMFDGNEIGGGETTLFMYSSDAENLFRHIEPTLRADDYCQGAVAVIRQGPHGSSQREVKF